MPIVIGMFLSFAIEHLVEPHPKAFWRRPRAALAIHLGIWISIYSCAVLLLRRPWFAMCAVLTIQLIVVLVSDAKLHSLREPFVFQDFEYFVDTMKHPRLFLPFLGIWRGLLLVAVFCTGVFYRDGAGAVACTGNIIPSFCGGWLYADVCGCSNPEARRS